MARYHNDDDFIKIVSESIMEDPRLLNEIMSTDGDVRPSIDNEVIGDIDDLSDLIPSDDEVLGHKSRITHHDEINGDDIVSDMEEPMVDDNIDDSEDEEGMFDFNSVSVNDINDDDALDNLELGHSDDIGGLNKPAVEPDNIDTHDAVETETDNLGHEPGSDLGLADGSDDLGVDAEMRHAPEPHMAGLDESIKLMGDLLKLNAKPVVKPSLLEDKYEAGVIVEDIADFTDLI